MHQNAIEIPLTEREQQILAKRNADVQDAVTRRANTLQTFAEMHGHDHGRLDFIDGKLYVFPPAQETPKGKTK